MNRLERLLREIADRLASCESAVLEAPFSASSLAIACTSLQAPVVVLTPNQQVAARRFEDLRFFLGQRSVFVLEPPDVEPYDLLPVSESSKAYRIRAISRLLNQKAGEVAIVPVDSLLLKLPPREFFVERSFTVRVGEVIERDALVERLMQAGYQRQPLTEEIGDFSVRGGVVDLFSPALDRPVRIELFGDEIDRMRTFDPQTQRTEGDIDEIRVLCASEVVLDDRSGERFLKRLKALADRLNLPSSARDGLADEVRSGRLPIGAELFAPLFHEKLCAVFDLLNPDSILVLDDPAELDRVIETRLDELESAFHRRVKRGFVVPEPESLFVRERELRSSIQRFRRISLGSGTDGEVLKLDACVHVGLREQIVAQMKEFSALKPLARKLAEWRTDGFKVIIAAATESDGRRPRELLEKYDIALHDAASFDEAVSSPLSGPILISGAAPQAGFVWEDAGLVIITDQDIFGSKEAQPKSRYRASRAEIDIAELKEGDFVVHELFGIGIYRGLRRVGTDAGMETDCVLIEYSGGDELYVPVYRLDLISKYVGGEGLPRIDRLGSGLWAKVKQRARASARKLAKELIRIYAERMAKAGHSFSPPDELFREFEATFPWRETPDQIAAIEQVLADLQSERPADRLICGDVGFGKTEVAIRAAFIAVMDGFQVAVLVPTTTLAFQHAQTFGDRLSPFGVRVEMLSRFVSPGKRKKLLEDLRNGRIDVIIGTHALLSDRVAFNNLGLLIVDEEQHFGVAQKEKIKKLKSTVDVLTLSATPIPRTLYMSLSGIRDISTIDTPPENRLSIKTYLIHFDEGIIRRALVRELERSGQAFFVHNRVQTIDSVAERIRRLVPDARIAVAHGQMKSRELEEIMIGFAQHRYDILVCTAIVESGLDFPQANTIFIDMAHTFGLAQLYQLRGRVGRSYRQAYAYLIVPESSKLTAEAKKRLSVIKSFVELGSGFRIAQKDLEIRGAGNLLGPEQSGHIAAIGFELYMKLLNQAVAEIKGERTEEEIEPEIKLQVPAFIPASYIPDGDLRLHFYRRLASVKSTGSLDRIVEEMGDRFGAVPEEVMFLAEIVRLKLDCIPLRIVELRGTRSSIVARLDPQTPVLPSRLVERVRSDRSLKLTPRSEVVLTARAPEPQDQIRYAKNLLKELRSCVNR